ncbi:ProQ/FINO family protein [Serratia oryzae]|uniref:ProQ/FinO domain-containing protein n=1 Tax=Serratia oryzae TaxID=2034155 RepID=A0A1S8CJF1_9GAMM|nr:ProQ/FinO family protein [Serratia oryzae]OMQ22181.1 hypothetical protein BMI79_11710 [Serratia oryzae]
MTKKEAIQKPTSSDTGKKSQSGAGGWRSVYIQRVQAHYPRVFSHREVKPLKVGIRDDMLADAAARRLPVPPKHLVLALSKLTKTPRYLRALVAGGPRYDLNGQPCGEVTAEEQENARMLLANLKSHGKKKRFTDQSDAIATSGYFILCNVMFYRCVL